MADQDVIMLDAGNARVHDEENRLAIRNSLTDLGTGRSIVVDKENVIIAGNGVFEQAQELGLKVRVVESDGSELVVIKRTDLATDDDKRKALALADNKTSDLSFFDDNALAEIIGSIDDEALLAATGFSDDELAKLVEGVGGQLGDGVSGNDRPPEEPPANTQCVIGPYRFTIEREKYEKWLEKLRQKVGFDDDAVIKEVKRRLKL
jgi:hypothetical protein